MHEAQLSEPSEELAARILARVSFNDRYTLAMVHPHTGPMPMDVYSFEQVANLLNAPGLHLDLKTLAKWLEKVMGDEELAARTLEAIEKSPQEKALLTRSLMQERLEQCRAMMEEDTDGE
jgi:lysozyme family protein